MALINPSQHIKLLSDFGDRVADRVTAAIGSWPFIVIQSSLLITWVILNVLAVVNHWDPYPFILLNLMLSFQAAYTGPIVMMSQNRASQKSELRAQLDYETNIQAERENTIIMRTLSRIAEKQGVDITDLIEEMDGARSLAKHEADRRTEMRQNHRAARRAAKEAKKADKT